MVARLAFTHKRWITLGMIGLLAASVFFVGAFTVRALAPSTFESDDGNLIVDTAGNLDWENAPNLEVATDQPTGQQDDSFGQGSKEDSPVPTVVTGSIPNNKSDLLRFYVSDEIVSGEHFLYLGWVRANTLGTANMDFEFNQSEVLSANGVTPVRTPGDMLITYDFASGGNRVELGLARWTDTGPCQANGASPPCWGPIQDLDAAANADGAVNNGFTAFDPIVEATLADKTFGEAGINLTGAGVFPADACINFGRAYVKSRSSDSFTAELKDFIAPIEVSITNCGNVVIIKDSVPDHPQDFDYTTTGSGLSPFSLDDDADPTLSNTITFSDVVVGTKTVTEGSVDGWELTSIVCDDDNSGGDVGTRTATINLEAGETVTCTFTNTARGTIIVEKQTDPDGAAGSFTFTGDAAGTISDGGQIIVPDLLAGIYTSTEDNPTPAFDLISITCDDTNSSGDVGTRTATFNLDPGETVTCTFTNRQRANVNIHKQDDASPPSALAGAVFTLFVDNEPFDGPAPGAEDTSTGLTCTTDASGNCTIANILPGQYWVVETTTPEGHDTPDPQHVVLGAGTEVSLTFTNPRQFTIIVLVCQESTNQLYPSSVTVDGVNTTSLEPGSGGALSDADLCSLGGARYEDKNFGAHPASIDIPQ